MQQVFAALDSDTRRQILVYLASGSLTFKEICERFDITGPAVLRHLRILQEAGLVTRGSGRSSPYLIVSENLVDTFNAFLGTVHPRVSFGDLEEASRKAKKGEDSAHPQPFGRAATT